MVQKPLPADRRVSGSSRWQAWLLVGLCFGLGYGVTHRLLGLRLGDGLERRPGYGFKAPPGTRLEDLRRQAGNGTAPIRADLDRLEKEEQQRRQKAEAEKRKAAAEEKRSQAPEPDSLEQPAPPAPEAESQPPPAITPAAPPPVRQELPPPAEVLTPPPAVGNDPPPPPPEP